MLVNKSFKKTLILFVLSYIILLFSGSVYYMFANKNLQFLSVVFFTIILVYYIHLHGLSNLSRNKIELGMVYLIIVTFSAIFNLLFVSGFSFILLFAYNLCIFYVAYLLTRLVDYNSFKKYFINVMCFFAVISIVGWKFSDFFSNHYLVRYVSNWDMLSFYIFNINAFFPQRNCGPFWEPGMYQAFLNFAILLLILNKDMHMGDYIKILILVFTVWTTFSTTGYIIMIPLILIFVRRVNSGKVRIIVMFIAALLMVAAYLNLDSIIFFIDKYSLYSISNKIINQNESFSTRIYSGICDLIITFKNPVGANRATLTEVTLQIASTLGEIVTARTSTLTTAGVFYGIINGVAYCYLWVRGCFKIGESFIDKILILLIMLLILQTEPHYDLLFFNIILFYWNSNEINYSSNLKCTA